MKILLICKTIFAYYEQQMALPFIAELTIDFLLQCHCIHNHLLLCFLKDKTREVKVKQPNLIAYVEKKLITQNLTKWKKN